MQKNKVYWVARHELTEEQELAIKEIHGASIEIVDSNIRFTSATGLYDFIHQHPDGYVYAIAGGIHYLYAFMKGLEFYIFEPNYISYDKNSGESIVNIRAIWKCQGGNLEEVWVNKSSYEYK